MPESKAPTDMTDTALLTGPLLVGVSGNHRSDSAVHRAVEIARLLDCPLDALHVVEADANTDREAVVPPIRSGLQERLSGLLPENVNDRLAVELGAASEEILLRARKRGTGLIVLGPHQRSGLLDLGGTVRGVLENAPCPVWTESDGSRPIHRVLVPVDLSNDSRTSALWACALARRLGATVTMLHVFEAPVFAAPAHAGVPVLDPSAGVAEIRANSRDQFERFSSEVAAASGVGTAESRFATGSPPDSILENQDDHDLIVMATQGRGALSAALLGSVTYAVLRGAERSVVAVRRPALSLPAEVALE